MDEFLDLCREVRLTADYLPLASERAPHYQQVLDHIVAHPEKREAIADVFVRSLRGMEAPSPASIYMIRFCMRTLKWPEIKEAAKVICDNEVNAMYADDLKSLIAIYEKTA